MIDEATYIGKQIGNYQVISEIARGAFGHVYLAQHIFLTDRNVAIKLLHSTHLDSKEQTNRFLQEARFLETLKHPHILPLLDVGIHENYPYLVTEYAPNGSLRDCIEEYHPQALPLEEALTVLSQVGQALHHAHQQRIIHRDLKPENILFNAKGDVVLADFGIATMLASTTQQPENNIGTPFYMAPEHFQGTISKESDQYALGCIAYEVFTGHKPFNAPNFYSLGFQHISEPPLAPRQLNSMLPIHIERAILKAMAKERANRFSDIPAFITALHTPLTAREHKFASIPTEPFEKQPGLKRHRPPSLFIAVTLALVLLLGAGGILYAMSALYSKYSHSAPGSSAANTLPLSATVLIMPANKDLRNTYTISAVTGTPNAALHQVQARFLSSTTQPQSKIVNATGSRTQAATQASGMLIIVNYSIAALNLTAGTVLPQTGINSSIQVQLNTNVTVPPLNTATKGPGTASVSAHIVQAGPLGNLPSYTICSYCNNTGISWIAYNPTPFTGGQDPQTYTVVQQSDLDGFANPLKAALMQSAQTSFQAQIHANEHLVGAAQCAPIVSSVPAPGQKATSVTVTITASCKGEVYDQQGTRAIAASLLKDYAAKSGYTISGQVATAITRLTVANVQQGTVSVLVNTEDIALYRFSSAQMHALATLIAGQSDQSALALLLKHPGVSRVTISLSRGNMVPADVNRIMITVADTSS